MVIKLLGYGEVGKAIREYIEANTDDIVIDIVDPKLGKEMLYKDHEFVLVAIPYSDDFLHIMWAERDMCDKLIIFSTVPIGTVENIKDAVHIPIEGLHPDLAESISIWTFFMGYNEDKYLEDFIKFFEGINKFVRPIFNTRATEAMKLLSTTLYGVNIEYARYCDDVLHNNNLDYEVMKEYNKEYNKLYRNLGIVNYQRYILNPPLGDIGGHCIRNNASYLSGIFPDIVRFRYDGGGRP